MQRFVPLLAAAAVLASSAAYAGTSAPDGYVTQIGVDSNGVVDFDYAGTRTGAPSCQSTSYPNRYIFDGTTAVGQARLSALYTAYSLHQHLILGGVGNCNFYAGVETLNYIIFQN